MEHKGVKFKMGKICIDPGHYGKYNRSPGVPEYYESDMTWKLANLQKKYLEGLGHTVILTRDDPNKDVPLVDRGKKSKGCDLFISDHSNAASNKMNEKVDYVAVYHLVDDTTTKCDDVSKDFAKEIAPVVAGEMGVGFKVLTRKAESDRNKDGMKNDNYYGVLHGARLVGTPGVIIEHGFHTNTKDTMWLLNDANLDRLAKAEAECIDRFLKKRSGESGEAKPADTPSEKPVVEDKYKTPFKVKVEIKNLRIRKGPGTNYDALPGYIDPGVYTITEVQNGQGCKSKWGKLKSGLGWISLDYATIM